MRYSRPARLRLALLRSLGSAVRAYSSAGARGSCADLGAGRVYILRIQGYLGVYNSEPRSLFVREGSVSLKAKLYESHRRLKLQKLLRIRSLNKSSHVEDAVTWRLLGEE